MWYTYSGSYLCKSKHESVWSRVYLSWNPWHGGFWRFQCLFKGHSQTPVSMKLSDIGSGLSDGWESQLSWVYSHALERKYYKKYRAMFPWITIFVTREVIRQQQFYEWQSHEWKWLTNRITRDKTLFTVNHTLFHFLQIIWCLVSAKLLSEPCWYIWAYTPVKK